MEWQTFGFKDDPLKTSPITKSTLELFTGHCEQIKVCMNVLKGSNERIVIEGSRGVGTTSFSNYLRFKSEEKKIYFTPHTEIKVEQGWRLETLLAAIISNFIRDIERRAEFKKLIKERTFQAAKSLSSRIAEAYRSFGINAFGFGANYGKQAGPVTQPVIVPSTVLGHHLDDLIQLVKKAGYQKGALFQLNNLDIGEIHHAEDAKYLFNALRDYTQIDGSNWLFVGDSGLRKFIAQEVDRLDDIISYEVSIQPLPMADLDQMIAKRVKFYGETKKAQLPIDNSVFHYLYKMTAGRLRYIFGLASRLINTLYIGDLTDKVTLEIAKPMLVKLGRDRVNRYHLSRAEEIILKQLVIMRQATPSQIAKKIQKTPQYTGRVLFSLVKKGMASSKRQKREHSYHPDIDAIIAFADTDT